MLLDHKHQEAKATTIFVHIGKCGGSSVRKELKEKGINFFPIHLRRVNYSKNKKYIIILRNPISRFISAFNWRAKLVCEDKIQKDRFPQETILLEKYETVNELAEDMYDNYGILKLDFSNHNFYIHHINEDIHFYIGRFLERCEKNASITVIVTETLQKDLKDKFDIVATHHRKKNDNRNRVFLSKKGYTNLRKYLKDDYDCIKKLHELNLLSEEQYKILHR